jgi:hypothetical protein
MSSALDDFERSLVAASEFLAARQATPAIAPHGRHDGFWRPRRRRPGRSMPHGMRSRTSKRHLQLGTLSVTVIAAVVAAVVVLSLSGHTPTAAQAFPVLNEPVRITPSELATSLTLADYGMSTNNGLDPRHGHPVRTPWGTGYVLTPAHPMSAAARSEGDVICLVAPGLTPRDWGASCGNQRQASSTGTYLIQYAYDTASRSARLIGLYPRGATLTAQIRGGARHKLPLKDGVLAINLTGPMTIAVTIAGHTAISHLAPVDRAEPGVPSRTASATSTTVAAQTRP